MTAPTQQQTPSRQSPAADLATAEALIAAYQASSVALRASLGNAIAAIWRGLGSYRAETLPSWLSQVIPLVQAAQSQMSALTVGYHGAMRTEVVGRSRTVRVDPASVSGADARNGVSPAEVYERPFHLVWRQLADLPRESGSIDQAIQAGLDRAVQTANTDIQLAKVQTSQKVLEDDPKVIGYRRVLEGAHSCGLCIVASTNLYHRATLLPIHGGCDCGIAEVYDGHQVDLEAEATRVLGDVHKAIADRFGRSSSAGRLVPGAATGAGKPIQYRDVLVTHEHGELGPVLAVRNASFTGPSDLNN